MSRWRPDLPVLTVLAVVGVGLARSVTIGADSLWLVALGRYVGRSRSVVAGVPFTDADTSTWVNVPVLGELVFAGAHALGDSGLLALQLLAALAALTLSAIAAKRLGAHPCAIAAAVALVALGALPAFGVARAQAMSLVPFVGLAMLLRSQYRRPNARIWIVAPLLVVWGNLHGAVLVGVALTGAYLLTCRLRRQPLTAIGVGLASVAALWATPAGLRSHEYYLTVLSSAAAQRGEGLWATVTLSSPFDILMIVTGVALSLLALRGKAPLWEWVAIAGLVVMTIQTSRHGVWVLLFLAPRAAVGLGDHGQTLDESSRRGRTVGAIVVLIASVLVIHALSAQSGSVARVLSEARQLAATLPDRGTVLAPPILAEALAVEGVMVWAGNPLDAFPRGRQDAYLNFVKDLATARPAAPNGPDYVVTPLGTSCPTALCPPGQVITVVNDSAIRRGWGR